MFINQLTALGLTETHATLANNTILIIALFILALLADIIAKRVLLRALEKIGRKTKNTWDDTLIHRGVFNRLAHIAPATILFWGITPLFGASSHMTLLFTKFILAYIWSQKVINKK